eukprot:Seg1275.1 transcript_id=Seg1275.1/GoldUCD/mRNA.D3Y31 product="Desert hedgehog protein" protein_id=Seg1275.1/GoldUCD/D3Y31
MTMRLLKIQALHLQQRQRSDLPKAERTKAEKVTILKRTKYKEIKMSDTRRRSIVKTEPPKPRSNCFPGQSMVMTQDDGLKRMDELQVGNNVLSLSASGQLQFSPIIMFMDNKPNKIIEDYVIIETENPGHEIVLTKKHVIFASKDAVHYQPSFAEKVQQGDFVKALAHDGCTVVPAKVVKVSLQCFTGAYAPLTGEGTILVNGVLASCYALTEDQKAAHRVFLPWRKIFKLTKKFANGSKTQVGLHWYVRALKAANRYLGNHPEIYAQ